MGILGVLLLLGIAQGWLIEYIIGLHQTIDLLFFVQFIGFGIVLYAITYFLVRTVTTVKVK